MSGSIDERVVEMQLENRDFEKNAGQSIKTLGNLDKALDLKNGAKGLEEVYQAAEKTNFAGLLSAADTVNSRLSTLGIVGVRALQNITDTAMSTGKQLLKSLTTDQISAGWSKYGQKTAYIQTLMNSSGKTIEEITQRLDKLSWFSDETSYSFTGMSQALAQMVSSGGDMDTLIPMLEGIANSVAFAGKGASEFQRILYNLNQSYSAGYLSLMDWRSVELAGVGSKELKQTFIDTAKSLGYLNKEGKTAKGTLVDIGNFSSTLSEKWVDKSVMEASFTKFAEMTEKAYEMVNSGEVDTASEAYAKLAKEYDTVSLKAAKSAQEAKSFTEAIDATKDAVSTGWASTFEIIFGNYVEATKLWTGLANGMWDFFAAGAQSRNELLQAWSDRGGRDKLIIGTTNLLTVFTDRIALVKKSFRDIFPEKTAEQLYQMTVAFRKLTAHLKLGEDEAGKLGNGLKGVFAVAKQFINIGKSAFKALSPIGDLAKYIGGNLLSLFSKTGVLLQSITKGKGYQKFFDGVQSGLNTVVQGFIAGSEAAKKFIKHIGSLPAVQGVLNTLGGFFSLIKQKAQPYLDSAGQKIAKITGKLKNLTNEDVLRWLDTAHKKAQPLLDCMAAFYKEAKNRLSPILATVTGKLENFGLKIKNAVMPGFSKFLNGLAKSKDPLNYFRESATALVPGISELGKAFEKTAGQNKFSSMIPDIKNALGKIYDTIKWEFQKIAGFLKGMDPETLITAALTIGASVVVAKIMETILRIGHLSNAIKGVFGTLNGVLGSLTGVFGSLKGVLGLMQKSLKAKKISAMVSNIKTIAISIAILAAAVALLASIPDTGKMWAAVGAIAALGAVIAGLTIATTKWAKAPSGKSMLGTAASIVALGLAVLMMAKALNSIDAVDMGAMGRKLLVLLALTGILVTAVCLLGKYGLKIGAGALSIMSIAASIHLMTKALNQLKDIDFTQENAVKLGLLLGAMALLGVAVSTLSAGAGFGLLAAVTSILVIIHALEKLKELDVSGLESKIQAISGILGTLAVAMVLAGLAGRIAGKTGMRTFLGLSAAILAMTLSVKLLAGMLSELSGIPDMAGALDSLRWIVLIVACMALVSAAAIKIAGGNKGFISLAISVLLLTGVVAALIKLAKRLNTIDFGEMKNGIIALGATIAVVAGLVAVIGWAAKAGGIKSLAVAASMLLMLAGVVLALIFLSALAKSGNLETAAGSLAAALFGIAMVFIAMGYAASVANGAAGSGLRGIFTILAMTVALLTVGAILAGLAKLPLDGIIPAAISLSLVMLALGVACTAASRATGTGALNMLAIVLPVLAVGAALAVLAAFPWQSIMAAALIMVATIAIIGGIAIGLGAVAALAGPGAVILVVLAAAILVIAAAMLVGAFALKIFAAAVNTLSGAGLNDVAGGLLAIAGPAALVGLALIAVGAGAAIAAVGIAVLGLSLIVAGVGAAAAGGGLVVFGLGAQSASVGVLALAGSLDALLGVLGLSNGSFADASKAVEQYTQNISDSSQKASKAIDTSASAGQTAVAETGSTAQTAVDGTKASIEAADTATQNLGNSAETAAEQFDTLKSSMGVSSEDGEANLFGGIDMTSQLTNAFSNIDTTQIKDKLSGLLGGLFGGTDISGAAEGEAAGGANLFGGIDFTSQLTGAFSNIDTAGIKDQLSGLLGGAFSGIDLTGDGGNVMASFVSGFSTQSDSMKTAGTEAADKAVEGAMGVDSTPCGEWFGAGVVQGIRNKIADIIAAATDAATQANEAFNSTIQVGSPAKKLIWSGKMFDEGVIVGIMSKVEELKASAGYLATEAMAGFDEGMKLSPVISGSFGEVKPLNFVGGTTARLTAQLAEDSGIKAVKLDLEGIKTQLRALVSLGEETVTAYKDGSDVYFDDGALAGRIDRRLGGYR